MEWEYRQHHLLTEWSDTKEQVYDECSEQTMDSKEVDESLRPKMSEVATQLQHVTCRQRKDHTMKNGIDHACSEQVTETDFPPQFDESDQAEMMSFRSEPYIKHYIPAMPLCSFPHGSTSLPPSLKSNSSIVSLPYRYKADLGNDRPLKAYAPRSVLDIQIGHRVKVILPSGKIGAGLVKYIGGLPMVPEICFGVELDFPENGLRNGVFAGHCYFSCKPSQGVFISYSKVLMILE
ncbi:CAP-Gly domain-containing linker protein 4 isoform X1 [Rhincodon typus]|uniref:CAP-Gly domain-containing linker protein 4 isoform X1 n=2 Tax=Rhincodon typus TaxID=259920 RepID=UPI00202F7871|nr:CAP-Gly domain-containing linker protein 4 isoform X1 [Rhincodon typus]